MSLSLESDLLDDCFDDYYQYGPPPLCHQHSIDFSAAQCYTHDEVLDSEVVYRSIQQFMPGAESLIEEYEDPPIHRSVRSATCDALYVPHQIDESAMYEDGLPVAYTRCLSLSGARLTTDEYIESLLQQPGSPDLDVSMELAPSKITELPAELFDLVLQQLPAHPDLFMAMRTSRSWCEAAKSNYARRELVVPAAPDALLHAVENAEPGQTLRLAGGVHMLSTELTVDRPLRLIGSDASSPAVLCSMKHVVVRTRSATSIDGVTMCRLGNDVGYPNTVVFAEASKLALDGCRITCGGGATSVPQALRAFDGVPDAGEPWTCCAPVDGLDASPAVEDQRQDRPQSGVWVGAAASVRMCRNIVSCTMGPGIKIYRGSLEAQDNTIAFSCRGANVVANGGHVRLVRNEIRGAVGDGISSWNNAQMYVQQNRIHSNSGSGVAINSVGGEVSITDNYVFNNSKAAVMFVTSQAQQAVLRGNKLLEQNGGGGVQGLRHHVKARPVVPQRVPRPPRQCNPTAASPRRTFDGSVSMET